MKYKAIVTKGLLKKCAIAAWLSALLTVVPPTITTAVGGRNEVTMFVGVAVSTFWGVCVFLIAYFYVNTYIGVRKWSRRQTNPGSVNSLRKAKLETKIAYTTFWLTIFAGISGAPATVVYYASPSLRVGYSFRWADTILQLNSLINPLLYWYRNRKLRRAALVMLRCRKLQRI